MDRIAQMFGTKASHSQLQAFLQHPLVATIANNPVNLVLLAILIYVMIPIALPVPAAKLTPTVNQARKVSANDAYNYLPADHPISTEWKKYTPRSLVVYDGTANGSQSHSKAGNGTILLSINRKVFDVTSGARFYGPDGPYGNFAGRDASRGMAKQSFDQDMLTPLNQPIDDLADLSHAERNNMKEWEAHFTAKYPVVGELVEQT